MKLSEERDCAVRLLSSQAQVELVDSVKRNAVRMSQVRERKGPSRKWRRA